MSQRVVRVGAWSIAAYFLLVGTLVHARELTVGVFLPATMADGDKRFNFGEDCAAKLQQTLGQDVKSRVFARFEDFSKALADRSIDVGVIDGWAAIELADRVTPLALAVRSGRTAEPWAIVAAGRTRFEDLKGKRLAVPRGLSAANAQLVANLVLGGLLPSESYFTLDLVPAVESSLQMFRVGSTDAILVPASQVPETGEVLFRSAPLPIAAVVTRRGGETTELVTAVQSMGEVMPFNGFSEAGTKDLARLHRLLQRGPSAPAAFLNASFQYRIDLGDQLRRKGVDLAFPDFNAFMDLPVEKPD